MSPGNNIDVAVVVSGQPVSLKVNLNQTVEHLVKEALKNSGNKGQPPSDWELRLEGRLLNQASTVAGEGIHDGATLFLSPRAGAGG